MTDPLKEYEQWRDFTYLQRGTDVQREVYGVLSRLNIMNVLQAYNPVLAGTVPLDIQVEGSDLDIICEVQEAGAFAAKVAFHFGHLEEYTCTSRIVDGILRTVIHFKADGWWIELFGQPRPTRQQNGYRHMAVESRVLKILGEVFKCQVIALKRSGVKTEPAFARLLRLEGDPYEALLQLYGWGEHELAAFCRKRYIP